MEISEIIKKRRLELGLTLREVALALGISESTVSRYETQDIQNMGIDKVEALAKVLKCSPAYLMGWEDSSEKPHTMAACFEGDEYTEAEIDKIKEFAAFVKNNKK